MNQVFLLQHLHVLPTGEEHLKTIGVYSSQALMLDVVERLKHKPGFRDAPNIVGADGHVLLGPPDGFYTNAIDVDAGGWGDGFQP